MSRRLAALLVFSLLLLLASTGCDSMEGPLAPSSETVSLESIIASASAHAVPGVVKTGSAPSSNGGPTILVSGNHNVVNGGTMVATIDAASSFKTIYVLVGAKSLGLTLEAPGGIDGYYEIQLPTAEAGAPVLMTFPQTIPLDQFDLLFAVADSSGAVGPFTRLSTTVTEVGTGDVQVTLSWDVNSDVDLHVVEPGGDELYYGDESSASGGKLDLDSNAACSIDGVRNENVTWPVGQAPRGTYTVRVDYWDSCGVAQTNFTVRINSGTVQLFSGSFTGLGEHGGRGSGRLITTFERLTGPAAAAFTDLLGLSGPKGQLFKKSRQSAPSGR